MVEIPILGWQGDATESVMAESARLGLNITSDGSLSKYPGSRHWHLKNGKRAGTLEVTHWPKQNRLWITYHSNRGGDGWVRVFAERLADRLAIRLGGSVGVTPDSSLIKHRSE